MKWSLFRLKSNADSLLDDIDSLINACIHYESKMNRSSFRTANYQVFKKKESDGQFTIQLIAYICEDVIDRNGNPIKGGQYTLWSETSKDVESLIMDLFYYILYVPHHDNLTVDEDNMPIITLRDLLDSTYSKFKPYVTTDI